MNSRILVDVSVNLGQQGDKSPLAAIIDCDEG